tara:strand:+ start:32484 stop:33401 length:918 start_codon:yes stop_codon:yes gene_type:complete
MRRTVKLPPKFHHTNNLMGLYYILHGLSLWLGLGLSALYLWGRDDLSLVLRAPIMGALLCVSGLALNYIGTLGHEGFHGNLNKNRKLSMLMGVCISSLVPFFCLMGYSLNHWKHHLYTNTDKDPDYVSFLERQSVASKMEGPRVLLWGFFCKSLQLTKTPEMVKEYKYPFKPSSVRWFAILDVVLTLATTVGYGLFAFYHLQLFVFLIALPYVVTSAYYTIQPYIEHAQVDLSGGDTSRSSQSWWLFAIFLGVNYHNEHHLYPSVQSHKMPALHRFLQTQGASTAAQNTESSFWRTLAIGAKNYY